MFKKIIQPRYNEYVIKSALIKNDNDDFIDYHGYELFVGDIVFINYETDITYKNGSCYYIEDTGNCYERCIITNITDNNIYLESLANKGYEYNLLEYDHIILIRKKTY